VGERCRRRRRRRGRRRRRRRMDSAWISHVSMEQGTLMSTYLRRSGSTHL